MKKLTTLLFFSIFSLMIFAQGNFEKRVVYIWDVTYSMHGGKRVNDATKGVVHVGGKPHTIIGYDPKYNIYTPVLNALIDDIKTCDEETDIWVVAFNSAVCGTWNTIATQEGKKKLIADLQEYCNMKQTYTSIYNALNYALENILKNDVKNVVKILTDGEDNETEDKFKALLANWCDIMEEHNIQASYYFKLIDEIKLLPELEELAERECMSIGGIEEWTAPKYTISGSPMIPLDVNQTSISLNFVPISENKLTSNATIHISSEDNILLDINQDIQVSATTQDLPINIKWKSTQSELNKLLPSSSEMTIKLTAKVVDGTDQLELNENNTLELTVRNGRVKYMKIAFK